MSRGKIKLGTGNRVVALIRVSDESQVNGHSLEAQRLGIERWCQDRGYILVKVYIEAGVSAHTDEIEKRPELLQLLQDAERGEFDIVVVHTLDRLARKLSIQMQALSRLARVGVGFASVNDPFDASTPQGRLMLNQMGSYNEFFSELLGIHVSKSFKVIAESGLTVGPVPFAYHRQEKGFPPLTVENEAAVVKEVFQRRTDGQSYGSIAIWLNDQCFRTREGNPFTAHSIKDILNNRFYCGLVKYKGKEYKGQHEAIISEELFQKVQTRKQRKEVIRLVHGPAGLLQGIVACVHCGNGLQSDRHRQKVPLYRERHAHECPTNNTSTVAGVIDKQVATIVHSLKLETDWKKKMASLAVGNYDGPSPEALHEKKRRLARAYADGAYGDEDYNRRLRDIDHQLELAGNTATPQLEEAVALFSDIPVLWNEATTEERRRLISTLVEMVYVDIETKKIAALRPTPAFRTLLGNAIDTIPDGPVELIPSDKSEVVGDGGDGGAPRMVNSKALLSSFQPDYVIVVNWKMPR